MAIYYPLDFKEKAKKLFPDWTKLHEALNNGSPSVARYLEGRQDESEEKRQLYEECREIMNANMGFPSKYDK